jgi:hypothetical protein
MGSEGELGVGLTDLLQTLLAKRTYEARVEPHPLGDIDGVLISIGVSHGSQWKYAVDFEAEIGMRVLRVEFLPLAEKPSPSSGKAAVEICTHARAFEPLYLQLDSNALATPSAMAAETELSRDGENLPTVLAELALNRPQVLASIRDALAAVVPGTGHFKFPRTSVEQVVEESVAIDERTFTRVTKKSIPAFGLQVELEGQGWIDASDLSEGTLLTLGLLTAVHANNTSVIMFDDIDRGLHPRAQAELIACLRSILAERPELQIICTTHSPFLLNHFRAEEVRVMGLDANRHAHVRTLSEHPDWEQWKETMQVGEFWSVVGDDWAGRDSD